MTEGERALAAGRLLSVTEVARLLGVCSATVYALCAKGDLPHVRVLNAIRVAPGDLEAFTSQRAASKGRHRTVTVAWADSPRIRLNLLTPKPN